MGEEEAAELSWSKGGPGRGCTGRGTRQLWLWAAAQGGGEVGRDTQVETVTGWRKGGRGGERWWPAGEEAGGGGGRKGIKQGGRREAARVAGVDHGREMEERKRKKSERIREKEKEKQKGKRKEEKEKKRKERGCDTHKYRGSLKSS